MENEKENKEIQETPKLSIVDEAAKIRDEILVARDELRAENEKKEKLQAESMLSGDSGGHVKPVPPKEVSPQEYSKSVLEGKVGDGKEE